MLRTQEILSNWQLLFKFFLHSLLQFRYCPFISFQLAFSPCLVSQESFRVSTSCFLQVTQPTLIGLPFLPGIVFTEVTRDLRIAKSRGYFSVFISNDLPVSPGPMSVFPSLTFLLSLLPRQPAPASVQTSQHFPLCTVLELLFFHLLLRSWCVSFFCLLISYVTSDELSRFCLDFFISKLKMVVFLLLELGED